MYTLFAQLHLQLTHEIPKIVSLSIKYVYKTTNFRRVFIIG